MSEHEGDGVPAVWLQTLIGALEVGIHAVDERGLTLYYNTKAGRLDGLEPHEVIGRHVLAVFPSLNEETSTLLRVLRSQETISHRRQSYRNYRGVEVHTSNTTRAVFDEGGRLLGALEVAADITEVQHLAERVVDLQAAALPPRKGRAAERGAVTWTLEEIVTCSPWVQAVIARARKVARTSSPVLVYGQTGVGKELLVQGIHAASPRARAPFIAQNCAALPSTLLEGILFGTVKGSFTGAENRPGLFELAHGGTLFLDELNSLPLDLQAKLLRVLEDGKIRRIGGQDVTAVDVRIIAAMNKDPQQAVEQGQLREDLYYRVQVVGLYLPSLAERREDIDLLVEHFIAKCNERFDMRVRGLTPSALDCLKQAQWRGNIRELKHVIEAAMNEVDGEWIDVADLPAQLRAQSEPGRVTTVTGGQGAEECSAMTLTERMEGYERKWIAEALTASAGHVAQAAERLGIPRQTLQSKMKKLRL